MRRAIEGVGRAVERIGLGNRHRHAILTVVSLMAVAVVAMAAYSRQDPADAETVRAGTSSVPTVQPFNADAQFEFDADADAQFELEAEPASPEVTTAPAPLRAKAGEAARFDTVPTTTTAPRPRPTTTAAPTTVVSTSTTEPEVVPPPTSEPEVVPPTTGTKPPNPPSTPQPSIVPEPTVTRPVETTVAVTQTSRPRITLPPFLTWLTRPPRTTTPPAAPDTVAETTTVSEDLAAP